MTRPAGTTRVMATHALFVVHLLVFLVLVVGASAPWHEQLLLNLGLSDLGSLVHRPWTIVSHTVVHRHPLEFMLAAGILLLAGPPLEQRLGSRLMVVFLLVSTVLTGLAHLALSGAGLVWPLFTGSIGMGGAILTGYLLVLGGERRVGSLPFPFFYVLSAAVLFAMVATLGLDVRRSLDTEIADLRAEALRGENLSTDERIDRMVAASAREALRPDLPGHMLGLCMGGLGLLACRGMSWCGRRVRVLREIRDLQDEVEARARVEDLLAKISREGIGALSRQERRFLTYASQRYYRSGRLSPATGKA